MSLQEKAGQSKKQILVMIAAIFFTRTFFP